MKQTAMKNTWLGRFNLMLRRGGALLALLACLPAAFAAGQFPTKPVEFWIPFPPGGSTDGALRLLLAAAGKELGQQVLPINKQIGRASCRERV